MSLRLSRRAAQGGGGGSVDVAPSVPISEIRVRKWTKQLKTVGHLSIPKWVPGTRPQLALRARFSNYLLGLVWLVADACMALVRAAVVFLYLPL